MFARRQSSRRLARRAAGAWVRFARPARQTPSALARHGPMMEIRSGRSLDTVPPTGQYHPQRCQGGLGARTTAWSCSHAERVGRYGGRRCRLLRATGVIGTRAVPQHGQRRPRFRLSARGEERADAPNREFGSLVQQEVAALSDALERPVAGRDAEGKSRADEVLGSHQLEHRHP